MDGNVVSSSDSSSTKWTKVKSELASHYKRSLQCVAREGGNLRILLFAYRKKLQSRLRPRNRCYQPQSYAADVCLRSTSLELSQASDDSRNGNVEAWINTRQIASGWPMRGRLGRNSNLESREIEQTQFSLLGVVRVHKVLLIL